MADTANWVAYGDTFPVKDQLRSLGGQWDKESRCWRFASQPSQELPGVVFAPSPLPEGWWLYEQCSKPAGETFRRPLALADRDTRQYPREAYAVSVICYTDKIFDDGAERWVAADCTLARPLTDAEWAAIVREREVIAARRAAIERFEQAVREAGTIPQPLATVAATVASFRFGARLAETEASQSETEIRLSYFNGRSGDDWSCNNSQDRVVWVASRTPELDSLFAAAMVIS